MLQKYLSYVSISLENPLNAHFSPLKVTPIVYFKPVGNFEKSSWNVLRQIFAYAFYRASATRISRVIQVKPMLLLRFSIHSVRTQKLRHNGLLKGREGEKLAACMTIIFFSPIFSSCHLKRSQMTLWYTDAIHTIMHSILTQKEDRRTVLWSKITKILVDTVHTFFLYPNGKIFRLWEQTNSIFHRFEIQQVAYFLRKMSCIFNGIF